MKLSLFEEEELIRKWLEILGPNNEVVVSNCSVNLSYLPSCTSLDYLFSHIRLKTKPIIGELLLKAQTCGC